MRIIAVRRPGEETSWVISPDASTDPVPGDVLVAKGTRAGAERLSKIAGDPQTFDT